MQLGAESSEIGDSFTWTTAGDPANPVISIDSSGLVTLNKPGSAAVKVTSDLTGESDVCLIKVGVKDKLAIKLSSNTFTYDGKIKMPKITVKSGNTILCSGITESNQYVLVIATEARLPGTYAVNVIARDWEYGQCKAYFKIKVKPTAIKTCKKGKKKLTARWKRAAKKNVTGYQIRYSLKKSMKGSKIKTVKGWKKTSLTIKKLKGGKRYYVQVRTYVQKDGIKYYSTWSKKTSVKVKK